MRMGLDWWKGGCKQHFQQGPNKAQMALLLWEKGVQALRRGCNGSKGVWNTWSRRLGQRLKSSTGTTPRSGFSMLGESPQRNPIPANRSRNKELLQEFDPNSMPRTLPKRRFERGIKSNKWERFRFITILWSSFVNYQLKPLAKSNLDACSCTRIRGVKRRREAYRIEAPMRWLR